MAWSRRRASTGRRSRARSSAPPPSSPHQTAFSRVADSSSARASGGVARRLSFSAAALRATEPARSACNGRVSASTGWTTPAPWNGVGSSSVPSAVLDQPRDRLVHGVVREPGAQQRGHPADLGRGERRGDLLDPAGAAVQADRHRVVGRGGHVGGPVGEDVLP